MPDTTSHQRRNSVLAVAAAVVVVAVAVVVAVWLTGRSGDDGDSGDSQTVAVPSSEPSTGTMRTVEPADLLPEPMGGQEAIDALGDHIEDVAELNNTTVDELRDMLLRDASLLVSPSGRLLYDDDMTPPATQE